jgi:hypothetical protein
MTTRFPIAYAIEYELSGQTHRGIVTMRIIDYTFVHSTDRSLVHSIRSPISIALP